MTGFVSAVLALIRNTHRHPANRALHIAGAPLYAAGIAEAVSDPLPGIVLWLAGVAMFCVGHLIEGNLGTITPVLVARLALLKLRPYLVVHRVHVKPG